MSVGTIYVPSEGPESCDLMVVGEAPGGDEERERRPFIGVSGQLLERYLNRHGLSRDEVFLTNLCKHRPKGNKFRRCLDTPELEEGLNELAEEIERVDPNVIVAAGGWPLYYLTGKHGKKPGSGILSWRGSILESKPEWGSRKVIPTVHPAFVQRAWTFNPIFHFDLGKAVKDSSFPELRHPKYESYIDPDIETLRSLIDEAQSSELVSLDIETFPTGTFSCIGFCPHDEWGCTITFQRPDLHHYIRDLWSHPVPKAMQFGTYDISFMRFFYGWEVGGWYEGVGHDTYVAAASLMPEFKRGLDFLASVYTRFPYYKEDRKVWKEKDDMSILFEYNIKDVIATWQIAMEQKKELKEVFG